MDNARIAGALRERRRAQRKFGKSRKRPGPRIQSGGHKSAEGILFGHKINHCILEIPKRTAFFWHLVICFGTLRILTGFCIDLQAISPFHWCPRKLCLQGVTMALPCQPCLKFHDTSAVSEVSTAPTLAN